MICLKCHQLLLILWQFPEFSWTNASLLIVQIRTILGHFEWIFFLHLKKRFYLLGCFALERIWWSYIAHCHSRARDTQTHWWIEGGVRRKGSKRRWRSHLCGHELLCAQFYLLPAYSGETPTRDAAQLSVSLLPYSPPIAVSIWERRNGPL